MTLPVCWTHVTYETSQKWLCNPRLSLKYSWMEHKPSVWVTWLVKIPLVTHNSFLLVSCLWHDNISLWCPKTTFPEFWPSKNCFFPNEMNQKLGKSIRSKKDWWCHVMSVIRSLLKAFSSDSGHCFVELSHVTDCKEGIVKSMKFWRWLRSLRRWQSFLFATSH